MVQKNTKRHWDEVSRTHICSIWMTVHHACARVKLSGRGSQTYPLSSTNCFVGQPKNPNAETLGRRQHECIAQWSPCPNMDTGHKTPKTGRLVPKPTVRRTAHQTIAIDMNVRHFCFKKHVATRWIGWGQIAVKVAKAETQMSVMIGDWFRNVTSYTEKHPHDDNRYQQLLAMWEWTISQI